MKHIVMGLAATLSLMACKPASESGLDEFQKDNIRQFGLANTKKLALTFDDGPSLHTARLLDALGAKGIKATFFINGANVGKDPAQTENLKDILRRMHDEGHIVANHTHEHRHVGGGIAPVQLVQQVAATHDIIKDFIGDHRLYFRAPYGAWSQRNAGILNGNAELAQYIGPVFWDIGGDIRYKNGRLVGAADWDCWGKRWSVARCAQGYLADIYAQKGGVVLMHDITLNSIQLVESLLPSLVADGFEFITLDEIEALDAFGAPAKRDPVEKPVETPAEPKDDETSPSAPEEPQDPTEQRPAEGLAFQSPRMNDVIAGKVVLEVLDEKGQATATNFYIRRQGSTSWYKLGTSWAKPFKIDWYTSPTYNPNGLYEIRAETWNRSTKLEETIITVRVQN